MTKCNRVECGMDALPGMLKCCDHTSRDTMAYYIRHLYKENKTLEKQVCEVNDKLTRLLIERASEK